MFVSPCRLRSRQCAALIALAAAAGISRLAPLTPVDSCGAGIATPRVAIRAIYFPAETYILSAARCTPALSALATAAAWYWRESAGRSPAPESRKLSAAHPASLAPDWAAPPPPPPAVVGTLDWPRSTSLRLARSCPHLLPFAVGPPTLHLSSASHHA